MRKLAVIDENKRIDFLTEVTDSDLDIILSHCKNMHKFNKYTEKFRIFKNTYRDLKALYNANDLKEKSSRLILELMSTYRALLDHWETEIKREFGKTSEQINIFKEATSREYDNHFEYRFIAGLRNYIQHVGIPNIKINTFLNKDNQIESKLFLSKKELIDNFDDWKQIVLEDLDHQPESFELIPILDSLYESIRNVNHVSLNIFNVQELFFSSQELLKLKAFQGNIKGELVIVEYENLIDIPLKIQLLPMDIAEYISKNVTISKK